MVFEHLTLPDLLNVVDSDENLLEPSIWAFRHNFGREKFVLEGSMFSLPRKTFNFSTPEQQRLSKSIDIWDYDVALKVLNYFGDSISRIAINYNSMTPDQITNIDRYIVEKSVKRLREIEFVSNSLELKSFKPLRNVETVTFRASSIMSFIDLNKLFPKMRRLELRPRFIADSKMITTHFPHLEFIVIHLTDCPGFKKDQVEILLDKNPQIMGVQVGFCDPKFLETINNKLPNLQVLQLGGLMFNFFESDIEPVHFVNLKKFSVSLSKDLHQTPEHFPFVFGEKLEEIELEIYKNDVSQQWLNFAQEQPNLKALKLVWVYGNLWKLSYVAETEFRNLKSFSAAGVKIPAKEMANFMKNAEKWEHLERIHLQYAEKSLLDDVNAGKYSDWMIETKNVSTNNMEITFSKKK